MSGNGFYYDEFLAFANQFHKSLQEENFILDVLNKLGNIMLTTAKENTPVGQYDGTVFFTGYSSAGGRFIGSFEGAGTTKQGGTLRRNWFIKSMEKVGDTYVVGIENNIEYGPWVNYGHRKSDHSGWVEGQFFLELTMEQIESQLPNIVGPMYYDYLKSFGFEG